MNSFNFTGKYHEGYMREVKAAKRHEADARNKKTPDDRRRANRPKNRKGK